MTAVLIGLVVLAFAAFTARRLLSYLHIFQQEEYDGPRFLRWMAKTGSIDRRVTVALLILGLAAIWPPFGEHTLLYVRIAALAVLVLAAAVERDPRKTAKKKLVMTARARRIYGLALVLALVIGAAGIVLLPVIGWIVPVQLVPLTLVAINLSLSPFERRVQKRYWREAHDKIGALRPTVIGVTGSYGKTSLKHILGHILQMAAPTLITPGSVNTPMGVARIVRENLGTQHRYFVVEMGAYGPGSIARLCDLAPPAFGAITAIGKAHYERYKSLDTVAETKFELAEAVARNGGKTVTWNKTLAFPAAKAFAAAHPQNLVVCGSDDGVLVMKAVRSSAQGVAVDIVWQGNPFTLSAPLYGAHHGENIALAFAVACTLGLPPEDVQLALRTTPQITHRLEVKPQADGSVLIDDAYNSNPEGFAAALETLDLLRKPGGRRILVTPGMVELGAAHDEEHARIGTLAAQKADLLLAVAPARIRPLVTAFVTAGAADGKKTVMCSTFAAAQEWLQANANGNDVILLENDLPDLFERKMSL